MGSHAAGRGAHARSGRAVRRRRRRRASRLTALGIAAVLGVGAIGVSQATGGGSAQAEFVAGPADGAAEAPAATDAAPAAEPPSGQTTGKAKRAAGRDGVLVLPTFARATGRYEVVAAGARTPGDGRVVRYLVEVEDGLGIDAAAFAEEVDATLNDHRGWGKGGRTMRFERVERGPVRFRVSLSSPELTDAECAPLRTFGNRSCFNGSRAVINAGRWLAGALTYDGDLVGYRTYLINHEVGHAIGHHGHPTCPAPGATAPIMVQQTKSLEGCTANPWPYPKARERG
jgi:hypothetical protein